MPKQNPEDTGKALLLTLAIIFVAGGYLAAWWTKQKILFNQDIFFFSFYAGIILFLGAIGFFIAFLLKEETSYYGFAQDEFLDKQMLGWIALACFILAIFSILIMVNKYEKGFGEQALEDLAKAEEKLSEFNYIKSALTGEEIERLLIGEFDSSMEEICKTHQNFDCNQIRSSYESVKGIFETKQKADNIAKFWGLMSNEKKIS